MSPEQFMAWASDQLNQYQTSPKFKGLCADVITRQHAGEFLTVAQIAEALEIPLWLAELSMERAIASIQARVAVPDSTAVN